MFLDKAIADRSKDYMNARRVAKEFEAITRGLNRNALAVPHSFAPPEEAKQVELWKKYIQWEKTNPLKTEDLTLVIKRGIHDCTTLDGGLTLICCFPLQLFSRTNSVCFVWVTMRTFGTSTHRTWLPTVSWWRKKVIWTIIKHCKRMLLQFTSEPLPRCSRKMFCSIFRMLILKRFVVLLPVRLFFNRLVWWFLLLQSRNRKDESIKIYEKLLNITTESFNPTLVYIQYMKFTRRTESITSARAIFKRAREDVRCGYETYVAAALMEYYCSKVMTLFLDSCLFPIVIIKNVLLKDINIACKIFELGLKKFQHEANYILSYIDFLSHLNEENNIRVLFERVLSSDALPLDKSL